MTTMTIFFGFCDACSRSYPADYGSCIHCGAGLRLVGGGSGDSDNDSNSDSYEELALGSKESARYPFLAHARQQAAGFAAGDITKEITARAVHRLEQAIAGLYDGSIDEDPATELLTFIAQLFIVKLAGVDALAKRFALAEARRSEQFLRADISARNADSREFVLQLLRQELGVPLRETEVIMHRSNNNKSSMTSEREKEAEEEEEERPHPVRLVTIPVVDYLMHTTTLRSKEWALASRMVKHGKVYLRDREVVRLVRHLLHARLILRIRAMQPPERAQLPEHLLQAVDEVRAKHMAKFESGQMVLPSVLPPCIRHIIDMMEKRHENVSHAGRILLATYMAANGRPSDEICSLFKGAPDYNEALTRKNVEYLAGQNAQNRAYHVKGCERVKADGFCFPDTGCHGLTHPLQYGREKRQ